MIEKLNQNLVKRKSLFWYYIYKLNISKLDKIRSGLFKIIEKMSLLIYKLDSNKKKKKPNIFPKNKLHIVKQYSV